MLIFEVANARHDIRCAIFVTPSSFRLPPDSSRLFRYAISFRCRHACRLTPRPRGAAMPYYFAFSARCQRDKIMPPDVNMPLCARMQRARAPARQRREARTDIAEARMRGACGAQRAGSRYEASTVKRQAKGGKRDARAIKAGACERWQ